MLAIVGDLSTAEAFAAAEKAFGSWPRRDVPAIQTIEPPPPTRRVVVVDRPGAVQTEIRVGHLAVARKHPDYVPFDLAIRILGGEGANRLFGVLRSERGLTYGASADLNAVQERRRCDRGDRHAVVGDGRGAAPDGGRVLAAAARDRESQ